MGGGIDVFSISQSRQDLDRIARIMDILAKFEAGQLADRLRLGEKLPIRRSKQKALPEVMHKTPQERFRLMLEELGTTFVKFGQLLSTRADIIGPEYAAELSKLQDSMSPFPTDQAKRIIKDELGKHADELFLKFENQPLASASIGQVHRAVLKNGHKVVVKVQRPGIEATIKEDLRIMHYLARLAQKHIPETRKYDPVYLVDEFERSIIKELNFLREANSGQRLKDNFNDDKGVNVPTVYNRLCTRRVLVMEEVEGMSLSKVITTHSNKFDKRAIARKCARIFFKMVLVDRFYHADMHPGNIMVLDNSVICLLDFGRVNSIDKETANDLFKLAFYAVEDDVNGLIAHMLRTGMAVERDDMASFKADISDVLDAYYSKRIVDVKLGEMLSDLVTILVKYDINRPRETAELARSILILEGTCTELDPHFNIAEEFQPYAKDLLPTKWDTRKLVEVLKDDMLDLEYMARSLPLALRDFMRKMEDGRLKIELEHKDLMVFSEDLDRISDKLSMALLVAALIVGSSLVLRVSTTFGLAGFLVSGMLGLWLALKIIAY